ncbi:hypothetical protein [Amycolatopsis sp. RTGN1]|uniref:hypothetical protein n=1 Tax=Amycolatopsis ponsaeliensis TaxID=2992142 RepID=UPI002550C3ED|nr:hypothetical protein [Amycolatopsis sp. RTGN1]
MTRPTRTPSYGECRARLVAGLAAVASYPVGGAVAAIGAATVVAAALHKMID